MKKNKLVKILSIIFTISFLFKTSIKSEIQNSIIAKVGNEVITAVDLENEIRTLIFLNGNQVNQELIDKSKDVAIKSLIRQLIKKNEIKKYNIKKYDKRDLEKYITNIANKFKTTKRGLKEIFISNNISYSQFIDRHETELLWNTLIFSLYKNQISINVVEIENEVNTIISDKKFSVEYKLSEIEIKKTSNSSKIIENILESIKKEGFKATAQKFSISPSAPNGGQIGWFKKDALSEVYARQIENLKEGETSVPIKYEDRVVILRIDEIKSSIMKEENNLEEIKNKVLYKKKQEKLNLFSRSHFSNLENTTLIIFR